MPFGLWGSVRLLLETTAVLAEIELRQGQAAAALSRIEPLLAFIEEGGTMAGTEYDLRNWLIVYWVLQANGDARAQPLIAATHETLLRRADVLTDAGMREAFLNNVPLHCEIVDAMNGESE